ncbi:MAG: hypothetical protein IJ297_06340 [Clostridia bacterium]|nr:hypothetical protein [Clostridia bacterium]
MQDIKHELLLCLLSEDDKIGLPGARDEVLALCLEILRDLKKIVRSGYYNDREAMEEIVKLLCAYGIDCGSRSRSPSVFIHKE